MSEFVPPCGPLDAKIVLIGEAPGMEEVAQGRPFVGSSGLELNRWLRAAGINREECYITNVCKTKLPKGTEFSEFFYDKDQPLPSLLSCWRSLGEELASLRPHIICCLGGESLRATTGKTSIQKWRGSILPSPHGKVVGTLHPAYVLRMYHEQTTAILDMKRVREESRSPHISLPQHHFLTDPTKEQILSFCYSPHQRVAFDIETLGRVIRTLALSDDKGFALCIKFVSMAQSLSSGLLTLESPTGHFNSHWSEQDEWDILTALHHLFSNQSIQFVAHNYPFDSSALSIDFGLNPPLWMDTMVAWHTCYSEMPKGLDFLCSILTRVPYYSDHNVSSDHENAVYNCYDAAVTWEISHRIEKELNELGVDEFYFSHVNPSIVAITNMQNRGVLINKPLRDEMALKTEDDLRVISTTINQIAGYEINPNSPKQVSDLLYNRLHLPVVKHHKTGRPTTDKNAMESLTKKYPQHAMLFTALRKHSELSTLLSGFLRKEIHTDGRIYTSYNVAGTVTGRLSSSEPIWLPGTNLQNIPIRTESGKFFRRIFVADPGYTLIKADLSQAEFRIVCWLARIHRIIEKYQHDPNYDIHRWVASIIYQKPESEITKDERAIAKNGVYGGNYSMWYVTAARTYHLDLQVAKFVLDKYREAIPEIPQWWKEVQQTILSTGMIIGPMGRKRIFLGRRDEELFRAAYSHSAQHLVGDIINRAITLSVEIFDPLECYPVMQIHDEGVWMCLPEKVDYYVPIIRRLLEYPISFPGVDVPLVIPADIGIGENWLDVKKV